MNRQQLEMFFSVAKNLNFTKAAAEFYTSQPTISRQISLLEEEWGFPLFVRNKKEVRLTSGGAIMLEKCKEAVAIIDAGIQENREIAQGMSGKIRIGCLETMNSTMFVIPTITYFNKLHPNITIEFEKRTFSELRDKLESGYYDMIFTFDFELQNMTNVLFDKFCSVRAGILFSNNHRLAKKKDLCFEDFEGETFILPDPVDSPGRKEELQKILGITCKNVIYAPNLESVYLNVRAGKGIALADTSITAAFEEGHYGFYALPENILLSVYYVWKPENLNPALALYINTLFLKEYIDVFTN